MTQLPAEQATDYSSVDPVLLAAAGAHIANSRCKRHFRFTADANEPMHECGSILRIGPLGARAFYRHRGRWCAAMQCIERGHAQVLDLGPVKPSV